MRLTITKAQKNYRRKYWSKKAGHNVYKHGMGARTTIAGRHFFGFNDRFHNENRAVISEAEEERKRINEKKKHEFLVGRTQKSKDWRDQKLAFLSSLSEAERTAVFSRNEKLKELWAETQSHHQS